MDNLRSDRLRFLDQLWFLFTLGPLAPRPDRPKGGALLPNYRIKLSRLDLRFVSGIVTWPQPRSLARSRLGLPLMRGR